MRTEVPLTKARRPSWLRSVPRFSYRIPHVSALTGTTKAVGLTLVALAPMLSVVIQRAGRPYLPLQDQAIVDLRVRDVLAFSRNTPLVGVYSHFGWNHPGPLFLYLAAPLDRLFGYAGWSTLVAFALLQAAAVLWTIRLAWKTGGLLWTAAWLSVVALSYVGAGPSVLQLAWNPSVALPFFVLFCLQCWVVGRGDPSRLLGMAFVASFLVQTHLGYAPVVTVLVLWSVVHMGLERVRQHRRVALVHVAAPVTALIVLWSPVLILDPILGRSSNLGEIVHFYLSPPPGIRTQGWAHGFGLLATEFRLLPPWLGGPDPRSQLFIVDARPTALGWLAVPVALSALAWWSARRRQRADLLRVVELVIVMLITGGVSLALLRGNPTPYLFHWRVVIGAATVILTATVVAETVGARLWMRRTWMAIVSSNVAVAAIALAPAAGTVQRPYSRMEPIAQSILAQLHRSGRLDDPALIRPWGDTQFGLAATVGTPLVGMLLPRVAGISPAEIAELSRLNSAVAAHGCLCGVVEFPSNAALTYHPVYMASMVTGRGGGTQ